MPRHPGAHGRSALAGTLRPDVPEESARKTLRTAVYELRRALGDTAAALSAGHDAIGLDDVHVRVDAREFARLCTEPLGPEERGPGILGGERQA